MRLLNLCLFLGLICMGYGEETCPEYMFQACGMPFPVDKFPICDSELEALCSHLKKFAECAIHYKEICPTIDSRSEPSFSLEFSQSLLRTIDSFCVNVSAWYKGVIKYGSCYDDFIDHIELESKRLPEIENKFNLAFSNMPNKPGLWRCYNDIRIATYVIDGLSTMCGKMAKELGLHFLNGVGFWNGYCLSHKKEAIQMMEDIEITFNPETSEDEFVALFENISDSYGSNKDLCLSNYKNVCQNPGDFIHDFPKNAADLTARCTTHKKYKQCLIDYQKDCGESIWGMHSLQGDIDTLNVFCNETSVLFHELATKGECLNTFYQLYGEETLTSIHECMNVIRSRDPVKFVEERDNRYPEDNRIKSCFYHLEFIHCVSDMISKDCGKTAKELMLQALKHNRLQSTYCKNYVTEAERYMKELKFDISPEYSLQEFIGVLENEAETD